MFFFGFGFRFMGNRENMGQLSTVVVVWTVVFVFFRVLVVALLDSVGNFQ